MAANETLFLFGQIDLHRGPNPIALHPENLTDHLLEGVQSLVLLPVFRHARYLAVAQPLPFFLLTRLCEIITLQ
jgi:hypothetical protein